MSHPATKIIDSEAAFKAVRVSRILLLLSFIALVSGCISEQLPGIPYNTGAGNGEEDDSGETGPVAESPRESGPLEVIAVETSDHRNEHVADNAIDGNLETRWSAPGDGAWIRFDLGESRSLSAVAIAWYKGDKRSAEFDIEVSDDAENWRHVLGGASSGGQLALERYSLPTVDARYLRIVGRGNTENMWNSITEVEIWGSGGGTNRAPRVGGEVPDPVAVVGESYRFQVNATDPDGDALSFRIENKPAWASFDSGRGLLEGVPGPADAGVTEGIVISVTDGWESSSIGPFSITVREGDDSGGQAPGGSYRERNREGMIEETFETGDYAASGFNASGDPPVVSADTHPVFEGSRSLQIYLDRHDRRASPSPYRRELKLVNKNAGIFRNLKYGKEYWVGFAIYLADDYRMPGTSDILFQLHDVPDQHLGESYKNPNLTLRIHGKSRKESRQHLIHQWVVTVKGDDREFTPTGNKRYYPTNLSIPVAPAAPDVGRWVTWVFNFRVSWRPDGFIRVWKDGEKVLERRNIRTAFNDRVGPYLNIGSYKPDWKRPGDSKNPYLDNPGQNPFAADEYPSRLSYLDAFRIAVGPDRYDDVAP